MFIFFFSQTLESYAKIEKDFFQKVMFLIAPEENRVTEMIDMLMICTLEEKKRLTFMKVKQKNLFSSLGAHLIFYDVLFIGLQLVCLAL